MWMPDHSEGEEPDDNQGDYEAFDLQRDERNLSFGYFSQIKNHKDHFCQMQFLYRSLASTWLLFFFAGAGFILSNHGGTNLPISTLLAVSILDILTILAILLIWHIDIILYEKLWMACVIELAVLEKNNPWLARSNSNLLRVNNHKRFKFFQSYYYISFILILLAILTCSMGFYTYAISGKIMTCLSIGLCAIASILLPIFMIYFSKETTKYDENSFTSTN